MSEAEDRVERLGRRAEVLEARLGRDLDALSRRKPVQAAREVKRHPETLRTIAIGAGAGLVALGVGYVVLRWIRAR